MSVEEYRDGDVRELEGITRGDIGGISLGNLMEIISYERVLGKAFSFRNDERQLIAVGGIRYTNKGVGTAWFLGTDRIPDNKDIFCKDVATITPILVEEMGLHRLQAEVMEDKPSWIRWAESYGFKKEGVMKHYYPNGKNAIMMARITGDHV